MVVGERKKGILAGRIEFIFMCLKSWRFPFDLVFQLKIEPVLFWADGRREVLDVGEGWSSKFKVLVLVFQGV